MFHATAKKILSESNNISDVAIFILDLQAIFC